MASGVYQIVNNITNHSYIGSSVNIQNRWNQHKSALRNNKHHSVKFQDAWNVYGESGFTFIVLSDGLSRADLFKFEQSWMDSLKPEYNTQKTAGGNYGMTHSPLTRQKMSASHIGIVKTQEWRDNLSLSHKGKKQTEQHARAAREAREQSSLYKLTISDVREIRAQLQLGLTQSMIASNFSIDRSTISDIKRGKRWKDMV